MPDPVFGTSHFMPTSGVPTPASSESSPSGLSELLAGMTVAELQRIHDNNDRLNELVENLPPLQRLLNTRTELVATNITLASKENFIFLFYIYVNISLHFSPMISSNIITG